MVLALVAFAGPAHAGPIAETSCDDLTAANADYEAYGPTDVNAQAGDGHLTVGENAQGTLTAFFGHDNKNGVAVSGLSAQLMGLGVGGVAGMVGQGALGVVNAVGAKTSV